MRKKFLLVASLGLAFLSSSALASDGFDHCSDSCRPAAKKEANATINTDSLLDITDYLSPWSTPENEEKLTEKQLNHYRENSPKESSSHDR